MHLSRTRISSFCGDVVSLQLISDTDVSKCPISWVVDGDSVVIREFSGGGEDGFHDGVLLILRSPGTSIVRAIFEQEQYTCNVEVRARKTAAEEDELQYFMGDFHIHSANSHDRQEFLARDIERPFECIRNIQEQKEMDFAVITDHGPLLNHKRFYEGFVDEDREFHENVIIFPGAESSLTGIRQDRYGLPRKAFGDIVTLNAADFADVQDFDEFCEKFADSQEAFIVLAHPQIIGNDACGVWDSALREHATPAFRKLVKSVEMGNGTDREGNLLNEYIYSVALDWGYQVAPSCNSDSHGVYEPGPGRTFLMAPEKSKEMFLDAVLNNRMYACESGAVKLKYFINGKSAPGLLSETEEYDFHIELELMGNDETAMPVVCDVISDYGVTVRTIDEINGGILDFRIKSNTARYFYLRLMDAEGRKTWSAPIWTGRAFDDTEATCNLIPVDKTVFTAYDEVSGRNVDVLVNDDPLDSFYSEYTTASIVIDMKKTQKICGLGHMAPFSAILRLVDQGVSVEDKLARFASDYRISVSCDGTAYHVCKEGVIRCFGREDILTFRETEARYVKFEVLSTAGKASGWKHRQDSRLEIAEISIFGREREAE